MENVSRRPGGARQLPGGRYSAGRREAPGAQRWQLPGVSRWRALLEARWQDRLHKVTELSLAFHDAEQAAQPHRSASHLMRRATAARRALADTDDALARLAEGEFGRCEQCCEPIPSARLLRVPEDRYCPSCA